MKIISRAQWGARHRPGFSDAPLPASEVWLHHSVTVAPDLAWVDADRDGVEDDEERAMRTLEQIGQDRFGGGISYTFAVMPSGRVYEGHGVGRQGAHTKGRNSIARAIVLVGDYSTRAPTVEQKRSIAELLQHGQAHGWWRYARLNGGHRQAPGAQTACPGDAAFRVIPEINRLAEDDEVGAYEVAVENQRRINRLTAIVVETQRRVTVNHAAMMSAVSKLVAGEARDITVAQLAEAVEDGVNAALADLPDIEELAAEFDAEDEQGTARPDTAPV
jgi:hypothetical protein